nr:uncharacterized mitochondrial protein AtMg00810-like [Tanacetum cinerariifolium]
MSFLSSPSSTNEVDTANIQVSIVSTQVSTVSSHDNTANLSDATVYAFLANQPNGSQLVHKDLEQIHEDDLEEIDLKSDTAGYNKTKVECFNCHKMGHFARECRSPRNQKSRPRNQDSSRKIVNVEDTSSKGMVAIDGAGFDWSYMVDDEVPTNMALMAFSVSEVHNSKTCSNTCLKSFKTLKTQYYNLRIEFNKSEFDLATYKRGLFAPPTIDLSNSGLEEFQHPEFQGYGPKNSKSVCVDTSNEIKKAHDAPIIKDWVFDSDEDESEEMMVRKSVLKNMEKGTSQRNFALTAVLTKSGIVPISTARNLYNKVNTAKLNSVNTAKGNRVTSAIGKQDQLGKFDGKSDEGVFVSYSTISKAFRVYNTRTRKVKKNLHITFLENKPMIAGSGPEWLFDIDAFSKSMNYAPVPAVNIATLTYADYPSDPLMPNLEDIGILNDGYDDRDEGAEADYNNLEKTRKMAKQNEAGLITFINKQRRTNHNISKIVYLLVFSLRWNHRSAFLYGTIEEENYVSQPLGFVDPEFPDRVYKVEKALYGLHQAPRACVKSASTPMETHKPLSKDATGTNVDVHLYRSMIGSLMYLTYSRPDIMFAVCACSRFQVQPKVSHMHAVKRIFRYLKGQPTLGLWYPKDSPLELIA